MKKNESDPAKLYGYFTAKFNQFLEESEGRFHLRDIYDYCDVRDEQSKINIRRAVFIKKSNKIIESCDDRNGCYRKIENNFKVVGLNGLENTPVMEINLPLGMNQYVEIMPKDLIVFAGVPNAGKTAIMLETARLNFERYKCWYFSTEMGARNCAKRLAKHENTKIEDWKINFVEDFSRHYKDIVQPDDLTFIDYVESDEPYKIPSILAGIQSKIRGGIAIVALQKNKGIEHAYGGYQTIAKPALFCSLENSMCKIVKAKNWAGKINPSGFSINFKIRDGINIVRVGHWEAP